MASEWDEIPEDEETKILSTKEVKVGELAACYQKWFWDGITAESLIFKSAALAGRSDQELEAMLRATSWPEKGSEVTIQHSDNGFTFVNFNFKVS